MSIELAIGLAITCAINGSGGGSPPPASPGMDFSVASNSMYVAAISTFA